MFGKVIEAMEQVLRKSSISIADIEGIGVGVPGKVDFERELPFSKQFTLEAVSYFGPFARAIWYSADYD